MEAIQREYYLHLSGQKDDLAIEEIYERHADLFSREAVDALRPLGNAKLLEFAAEGHIGRECRSEEAELARREAELEIEVDGASMPFRQAAVAQANEPDPERRQAIEAARNEATAEHLNPLLREMLDRSHALSRELGWPNYRTMCEELSGIDLGALEGQTAAFLEATEHDYRGVVEPQLREHLGVGFDDLRRSDLPAFFRAPSLDPLFPQEELLPSFERVIGGMRVRSDRVHLDLEDRPKKSPRAFCSPVVVPDEVYLVIARLGGREDYETLFHEAGHALHFSWIDRDLPFEDRCLGDNSVTEGFAFLLQGVASQDPETHAFGRAYKLVFLRRYCAKLAYELELHTDGSSPEAYARRLSDAVRVEWPETTWLSDVDPFFYAARYLRAWAFETQLRKQLEDEHGERWYETEGAGRALRELWRQGQRAGPEELLGRPLDFGVMLEDLALTS